MNLEEIVEEEFIITDGRIPKTELGKQIRPGIEATKLQKSRRCQISAWHHITEGT